jgi:SAM-dependent methyltransferase
MGRGSWELARAGWGPVIGLDLNISMLRMAQRLLVEGEITFSRRRVGVVYDPVTVRLPEAYATLPVDFWAADATRAPFRDAQFAATAAINVIDCINDPAALLMSAFRQLGPGGPAIFTTPFDWSTSAVGFEQWIGGHSQRGPTGGASEPALRALLTAAGFQPNPPGRDIPWALRLHERATMQYSLHLATALKPL